MIEEIVIPEKLVDEIVNGHVKSSCVKAYVVVSCLMKDELNIKDDMFGVYLDLSPTSLIALLNCGLDSMRNNILPFLREYGLLSKKRVSKYARSDRYYIYFHDEAGERKEELEDRFDFGIEERIVRKSEKPLFTFKKGQLKKPSWK